MSVRLNFMSGWPAYFTWRLSAWAYLAVRLHNYGFAVGLIFFGIACVIRSYLIIQSKLFPKFIGVLLGIAGICYLINSLALLLASDIAGLLFPWIMLPVLIGELTLSLWMIFKGVHLQQWHSTQ